MAENIKVRVNEMNEDIENRTNDKLENLLNKVEASLSTQLGEHGGLLHYAVEINFDYTKTKSKDVLLEVELILKVCCPAAGLSFLPVLPAGNGIRKKLF